MLNENSNLNKNGIGLGLFICKSISEGLGGWIKVKSQERVGSTFTFCVEIQKVKHKESSK